MEQNGENRKKGERMSENIPDPAVHCHGNLLVNAWNGLLLALHKGTPTGSRPFYKSRVHVIGWLVQIVKDVPSFYFPWEFLPFTK